MHKEDYRTIAGAIRATREVPERNGYGNIEQALFQHALDLVAVNLSKALAAENPQFDMSVFILASKQDTLGLAG